MSKAFLVESILAGLVDASGNPLASGKVYTYAAGTTTPKSLYTDSGASSAAANPLILSANGTAQVYADGSYKFVINTAADVLVATRDNLNFYPGDWTSWTPTISVVAPFTFTGVVINNARFLQAGKLVTFISSFSGTAGGTLASVITMSLPVTGQNVNMVSACQVTDGGVIISGSSTINSTTAVDIRKYNAANYTAGAVGVTVHGFYEAA